MSQLSIESIVIEPKCTATACVIWLHGLGDSGDGFAPVVPALGLPENHSVRFIFPHAPQQPVTINGGYIMRAWYDIKGMDLEDRAEMSGVLASEQSITQLIEEQIANGIPANKIILAGFSQGGVMSLFTGLRFSHTLAGIMALSCYLPTGDKLPENLSAANKETPILQHHGVLDDVVPLAAGEMARNVLLEANYPLTWKTFDMAHNVLPTQLSEIAAWFCDVLTVEQS